MAKSDDIKPNKKVVNKTRESSRLSQSILTRMRPRRKLAQATKGVRNSSQSALIPHAVFTDHEYGDAIPNFVNDEHGNFDHEELEVLWTT
jgi:hypothetical protein